MRTDGFSNFFVTPTDARRGFLATTSKSQRDPNDLRPKSRLQARSRRSCRDCVPRKIERLVRIKRRWRAKKVRIVDQILTPAIRRASGSHRREAFNTTCSRARGSRSAVLESPLALNPALPLTTCLVDRSKAPFLSIIFRFRFPWPFKSLRRRIWIRTGARATPRHRTFDGIHASPFSGFSMQLWTQVKRATLKPQVYHACGLRGLLSVLLSSSFLF